MLQNSLRTLPRYHEVKHYPKGLDFSEPTQLEKEYNHLLSFAVNTSAEAVAFLKLEMKRRNARPEMERTGIEI